jgi:hypothetical protein
MTAAAATSVRQRAPDRRAVRVTTLASQVRTSDTRWSHTATADTATEESCSRGAHREREQQALDPQLPRDPRAEAFGVYLRDLRHLPGPKIRRLRSVPEDQWFPRAREECDPRF